MQAGEGTELGAADSAKVEKEERKCPVCGKPWTKTEPTLAQVRRAIQEELCAFDEELHRIEPGMELGYRGSIGRGTVGDPDKPHYEREPDIRGECGTKYDVDGFVFSAKVYRRIKPDRFGKRWASRDRQLRGIESRMRGALSSRSELAHMKRGAAGFGLLVRNHSQRSKLFAEGGVIMLIPAA